MTSFKILDVFDESGSPLYVENYRPISLLCIAGKIFEKIMGAYQLVHVGCFGCHSVYHTIWYIVIDIMLIYVSSNLLKFTCIV